LVRVEALVNIICFTSDSNPHKNAVKTKKQPLTKRRCEQRCSISHFAKKNISMNINGLGHKTLDTYGKK